MPAAQNIVGSQVKLLRRERGLTQAMLAARCGLLGWDIGENIITKIETKVRCVTDAELLCLSKALDISPADLLPAKADTKPIIAQYFAGHSSR